MASQHVGSCTERVIRVLPLAAFGVVAAFEVRFPAVRLSACGRSDVPARAGRRKPSRTVYVCLPLLILWANVHRVRSARRRPCRPAWTDLAVGAKARAGARTARVAARSRADRGTATLLAGDAVSRPASISYYRATLLQENVARFVTEWQPVTTLPVVAVDSSVLLVAITVWSFGRRVGRTTVFERCALLVLAAGAIPALRNVVWFSLATLIVLPGLDRPRRAVEEEGPLPGWRQNAAQSGARHRGGRAAGGRARPGGCKSCFRPHSIRCIRTAHSPRSAVPSTPGGRPACTRTSGSPTGSCGGCRSCAGGWAYDASFELLSSTQLQAIGVFKSESGADWSRVAGGYRLLGTLTARRRRWSGRLRAEPGTRRLFESDGVVVLLRPVGPSTASAGSS